jgi:phosphoribosyl 1,2-cyclic phosphate phosphodiesterase
MKLTFLGTGTSVGIPVIGCECRVCLSTDPRNRRRRSSLYVQAGGVHMIVDTSTDFREQAIACHVPRVDAVLVTHSHADHIFGLDDVRRYNTLQGARIPVYGSPATLRDLLRIFDYVGRREDAPGVFRPQLDFHEMPDPLRVGRLTVVPVSVEHGRTETLGFRLEAGEHAVGYAPDCSALSEAALARFRGVDVMILDALRHRPHPTHFTVAESVRQLQTIGARQSFITHLCHDLDHEETQETLPPGVFVSCDGMTLEVQARGR